MRTNSSARPGRRIQPLHLGLILIFLGFALLPFPCLSAVTTTYEYDPLNRLSTAAYGTSFTETYTYDPTGNRTSLAVSTGGGLLKQQQKSTKDLGAPGATQAMKMASLSPALPLTSQIVSGSVTEYTYRVFNQASMYSFFLHFPGVPHKPRGGRFPYMGNIDQVFEWKEKSPCPCCAQ